MMKSVLSLIALSVLLSACGPGRPDLRTIQLNREGNSQLKGQNYSAALEKYLEGLKYDPFAAALQMNLGLTFEGSQQVDKALQSYMEAEVLAEKENNPALLFMARFNLGQLLGKAQRVEEALAAYQRALEIEPASKETKTNIELLTAKQSGQGQGDGENKKQDQNQQGDQNQKKQGEGQGDQEKKDPQDGQGDEKEQKPQQKQSSPKYVPRPFKGKELSEGDVKKILGELKQQEEKIRAEYNRQETKEQPRDKDW